MENGKVKSFKLTPKGSTIKFTSNVVESGETTFKENTVNVHRTSSFNLTNQLKTLLAHALIINGIIQASEMSDKDMSSRKIVDMPKFKRFSIIGFSLNKDQEDEEISFTISVLPEIGSRYEINTKPFPIHSEKYVHSDLLFEDKELVVQEVESYIEGNNYYAQGNLFNQKEETPEAEKQEEF